MFRLASPRPTRRPSLTPMIDVVFLLLVFFMLAARFGVDAGMALAPASGGAAQGYDGPPRLVEFAVGGQFWLNGVATPAPDLPDALAALMPRPDALVILRPRDGADIQALADAAALLQGAGVVQLVVMEP